MDLPAVVFTNTWRRSPPRSSTATSTSKSSPPGASTENPAKSSWPLGTADTLFARLQQKQGEPIKARVQPFGFLAAAWGLAQKLQLVSLIDRHVPKRQQGASVGQYLVLAALNRLTSPNSKARMAQWYRKTPLQRWLPLSAKQLRSQRFWDAMNAVDESAIRKIEMQLSRQLVEDFGTGTARPCQIHEDGSARGGLGPAGEHGFQHPALLPRLSRQPARLGHLRKRHPGTHRALPRARLVSSYPTSGSSGGSARQVPIVPGCPPGGSDRLPHFQEGFWASLDHRGHPQPGIARGTTPRHRASAREASPGFRRTAGETQAEPRARGQGEGLHLREPGSPRPESFLRPIHPEDPAGRNRAAARKAPVALPHRCAGLGEAHRHLLGKKNSVHRQPPVDDRGDHSGVPQSASCGGCLPHHEGSPLRGLGASLSLDRSKNPCPCFLLRAGPDSGWAVAPRSPPRRPGAQSRRPLSGTLFDLRNHQSLSLDFEEEGGPSSRLHHVH